VLKGFVVATRRGFGWRLLRVHRDPGVDGSDAIFDGRMGHHIGGDLFAAEPLLASDPPQSGKQSMGVITRLDDILQAVLVGL
jgi:hypothetical protein